MLRHVVVVSGAPGTGKSTVAGLLAEKLEFPLLSLDIIKEAIGDVLGAGDENWSDRVGDAAAEVLFQLTALFPGAVAEGWWRRERRVRAIEEFRGCVEVFCHCEPELAAKRAKFRLAEGRHPIHRDVVRPEILDDLAEMVRTVEPLDLGGGLITVDTSRPWDLEALVSRVATALAGLAQ